MNNNSNPFIQKLILAVIIIAIDWKKSIYDLYVSIHGQKHVEIIIEIIKGKNKIYIYIYILSVIAILFIIIYQIIFSLHQNGQPPLSQTAQNESDLYRDSESCLIRSCDTDACIKGYTDIFPDSPRSALLKSDAEHIKRSLNCTVPPVTPPEAKAPHHRADEDNDQSIIETPKLNPNDSKKQTPTTAPAKLYPTTLAKTQGDKPQKRQQDDKLDKIVKEKYAPDEGQKSINLPGQAETKVFVKRIIDDGFASDYGMLDMVVNTLGAKSVRSQREADVFLEISGITAGYGQKGNQLRTVNNTYENANWEGSARMQLDVKSKNGKILCSKYFINEGVGLSQETAVQDALNNTHTQTKKFLESMFNQDQPQSCPQ